MSKQRKVLFFTGAGLSAESGVPTFRDKEGLWDEYDVDVVCNYATLERNIDQVFEFYNKRRTELSTVEPNSAHLAMASLQQRYGAQQVKIITQNVDDLLERAGCTEVLHVHGELTKMMCRCCDAVWEVGYVAVPVETVCPECGEQRTKPNVVLFGEMAPHYATLFEWLDQLTSQDLFVVIGSSGAVLPVNQIVGALPRRTEKLICNLEQGERIDYRKFEEVFLGRVTDHMGQIIARCQAVLSGDS